MGFQSGINQLLGMSALFSQLPSAQGIAADRKLASQAQALQAQQDIIQAGPPVQEGTVKANISQEIGKQMTDVKKQQFERHPNAQTLNEYTKMRSAYGDEPIAKLPADPDEIAAEKAEMNWKKKATSNIKQVQSRRNFMNYLRNEPISWGGKVGDLPIELQKQIASQYSKTQRRNMMNKIDRENK